MRQTIAYSMFLLIYIYIFFCIRNLDLPSDTSYKLKLFMDFKEWQ